MLLAFCTGNAAARDYFVDVNSGSDVGTGSETQPFRTIQRGVDAAQAGDRVIVRPGTFTELNTRSGIAARGIHVRKTASAGSPITVMAATVGTVVIDQGSAGVGFEITSSSDVIIRGFVIRNCIGGGIRTEEGLPSTRISIEQNSVEGCNGSPGDNVGGIYIGGCSYCLVRGNRVRTVRVGGVMNPNGAAIHGYDQAFTTIEYNDLSDAETGIFHKRSSGQRGLVIRRNRIWDVNSGIVYSVGGAGDPPHVDQEVYENIISPRVVGVRATVFETAQRSRGLSVRNNVFTSGNGINLSGMDGVVIENNIFHGVNEAIGTERGSWQTELVSVRSNLFWPTASFALQRYGGGAQTFSSLSAFLGATGFPTSNRLVDPQFSSPGTDWRVGVNSPARRAGTDARDIGAYPTGSGVIGAAGAGTVAVSPSAPSNLVAQ